MDSPEVSVAISISIISVLIGFTIFIIFFDPWTASVRPRYRGFWKQLFKGIRLHIKKISLIVALVVGLSVIVYLIVEFADDVISRIAVTQPATKPELEVSAKTEETTQIPQVEEPDVSSATFTLADHNVVNVVRFDQIPAEAIEHAKSELHILFIHGSYGSQITFGMKGLIDYKGPLYDGLDLKEFYIDDDQEYPAIDTWPDHARSFLSNPANQAVNVVMWSWRDMLTTATEEDVERYLQFMVELEEEYPDITFVYMTGHVDGKGLEGNTHKRNEQIRSFCKENNKVLYDFADIESYDPDGNYFLDKLVNEGGWYDNDGDYSLETNWAKQWIKNNPEEWYECISPHTLPLNANLKTYAAWWLWARLAGWNGEPKG